MARTSPELADLDGIDARLREMFAALAALPIPSRLLSVIDQIDEPEIAPPRMQRRLS
jgi:hypothetical protein